MNKYNNLKISANIIRALAVIIFAIDLLAAFILQGIDILFIGFIGAVLLFGWGEALLALVDIAQSVRVSAVIAHEQDERRKAKVASNGKSLGLQHVNPEKRRSTQCQLERRL